MASPRPPRPAPIKARATSRPDPYSRYPPRPPASPPEVVDPRWLLKALGITIAVAAVFGYLSVCLLVYLGGWQLMLHPTKQVSSTPAGSFEPLRFDAAATGAPRLSGWWIPGDPMSRSPVPTLLYLHDGNGSLGDSSRSLDLLHQSGANIFAFDYRGFGQSDPPHPSEVRMSEDTAAALTYLTDTRHIPISNIVPYGVGLGAALAVSLSNQHPELRAFVLDNPDPDAFDRVIASGGRSRLLPMRLLVQDRFDLTTPLAAARRPKLLIAREPSTTERQQSNEGLFRGSPEPKRIVILGPTSKAATRDDASVRSVKAFLAEYLSTH